MTEFLTPPIDVCMTAKSEFEDAQKAARVDILDRLQKIMQDAKSCDLVILDQCGEVFNDIIQIEVITNCEALERGLDIT